MAQLKSIRISNNTSITISSLLNLFHLCLICFLFICKTSSLGVNAQQKESDGTITIPIMQWVDLRNTISGTPPPGLKDFAFGYSIEHNLVVIFGGTTPMGVKSGATYLMDLSTKSWKTPSEYGYPSKQLPEARSNMIFGVDKYSSYRNALIISCGEGPGNVLYNDVWAFDFRYKVWSKVTNVTGEIPPMYGSFGGIDTTLAKPSTIEITNTLWSSHGTNGTHFFTDLYALVTDGNLSPNLNTLSATWHKIPVSGEVPSGRSSVAGTILPSNRLALYGGCDKLEGECATSASYSLNLGSNYVNGKIDSATPLWSKKNSCLGARSGAAMVMNVIFPSQAIVYGGRLFNSKSKVPDGEVGVFDADLGNWVRVFPQKDPISGYPPQRQGARMIEVSATDILLFGGEGLDGNNLNDYWILRLNNNNYTSGYEAKSMTNPPMTFLDCIMEEASNTTKPNPPKATNPGTGDDHNSGSNELGKAMNPKSKHATFSTISFAFLPLAASVIRFGYGSNQKWVIAVLYTLFIVVSYATAFYGFAIAFQIQKFGHFNTPHGLLGLVLILLIYIFVPLVAIISLCISKKYESYSISDDDSDNGKRDIGSKLTGLFNWRNSESNSKPTKSFEVSRPGNRLVSGGEIPSQSPPMSMLKSSDNWMETRKSVTIAENHPTMSSQGSRNDSLQNGPSSRRTSQSTAVSRSGLQTSISSSSAVVNTRRFHHVVAQLILILTAIYIGEKLITAGVVDSIYIYMFIPFIGIIYLIWIVAAWYGYPKSRNSLLVLFMHKIFRGKGEINETKQYDFDNGSYGNEAIPTLSSNRIRSVRIEDDEMDEEAEQAQLEQDMHNREVVVMTIPKRRLTVVNA